MTANEAILILTERIKSSAHCFKCGSYIPLDTLSRDERILFDAYNLAVDALKKTIPVQPTLELDWPGTVTRCPACGSCLYDSDFQRETNIDRHKYFCIFCGQRFTKPGKYLGEWEEI